MISEAETDVRSWLAVCGCTQAREPSLCPSPSPLTSSGDLPAPPLQCHMHINIPLSFPSPSRICRSPHTFLPRPNPYSFIIPHLPNVMPAVVSNATRIWELNIQWDLFSQCGVWDAKGRGVDIYECVRARTSLSSTLRSSFAHAVDHYRPIHPWDSGQSSPSFVPRWCTDL